MVPGATNMGILRFGWLGEPGRCRTGALDDVRGRAIGAAYMRVRSGRRGRGQPHGGAEHPASDEIAEREPADVREERHAPAVGTRRQQAEVALDELAEEPDPEEDPGRNADEEDEHERQHARARIQDGVGAEDGGDRAAAPSVGTRPSAGEPASSVTSAWIIE